MRDSDLTSEAPGKLVPYGRTPYYLPDPLPPKRDLHLDGEFYDTLSSATFWLGKLSGLSLTLDFAPVLYTSLLRKEAIESSEIEGADVDFNALYSVETKQLDSGSKTDEEAPSASSKTTKDTREVLNYERAITQGIEALDAGDKFSIELLHQLHKTLLAGVPSHRRQTDTIGEFKTKPNHLGDFLPPSPGATHGAMDALLTYIRTGGSYHPLVDIALVHYQFETIHPYGDGNGRLGRLFITLQLYEDGYLEQPNLYLSEYFNRNKQAYVDRMEAVRKSGRFEEWLSFFITGIEHQARESVERSLELRSLQHRYNDEYGESGRADARLARALFERPYVTASLVEEILDVSGPTAYRAIESLQDDDVLEEVTGKERNREYRAVEIFEILERPPTTY